MLDLSAHHAPLRGELAAAVARVLDSGHFILGQEVAQFEEEAALQLGVRHAIGVSSGTDALLVALMALGIGPGDEVVTTPFSFFATAGSIRRLGATPVFADIDPETLNVDPGRVASAITPRTRAILPVHLFGQCAEMGALCDVARRHGLAIVEDAAQAFGSRHCGRPAGALGDVACFSFYPSKNLGAAGDAGLVTTNDETIAQRVRTLRSHGAERKYEHLLLGGNFRLDELQAAILRVKLPHVSSWNEHRRAHAALYDRLLAGTPISTPVVRPHNWSNAHHYTVRLERRDVIAHALAEDGIETAVYYPIPLHLQPCFADLGYHCGDLPKAEAAAGNVLSLPVYPELTNEQVTFVAEALRRALMVA